MGGARRLLQTFTALGTAAWIGYFVVLFAVQQPLRTADTRASVVADYQELTSAAHRFSENAYACRSAADPFDCQISATDDIKDAVHRLRVETAGLAYPSNAQDEAAGLERAGARLNEALADMSNATGSADYVARLQADDFESRAHQLDLAYDALMQELDS